MLPVATLLALSAVVPAAILAAPAAGSSAVVPAAILAAPAAGSSVGYRAAISGSQEVTWRVDGTTTGCERRQGTGSGRVAFRFRPQRQGVATAGSAGGLSFGGSISSIATGTISGSFADRVATPCPGFEPRDPFVEETRDCGPLRFGLRIDLRVRGAFLYVTGVRVPLGPVSIAALATCPFAGGYATTSDRRACGDGRNLWQRSWGVTEANGRGLLASRIAVTPRRLLRPARRTVTLTDRTEISCTVPSQYSGGVRIQGELRWTLTLTRLS